MIDIYTNAKWQIVLTRPNCEKKVTEMFAKKGIEYYWPLNTYSAQGKNRTKFRREPLFKSYVFVKITESQSQEVLKIQGTLNFVYWLNKPAVVNELEIDTIKLFLHQYHYLHLEKTEVNTSDPVKSVRGSTITKAGNITEMLNNATKAILPSLGYILISHLPDNTHSDTLILNNNVHYKPTDKHVIKEQI